MTNPDFKKTEKQSEAIRMMGRYIVLLLEGGGRSGKTFIEIYAIITRMHLYYKKLGISTRHLIVRQRFDHAKKSLWYDNIPKVLKIAFPGLKFKENKQDWYMVDPISKSELWIGGTDDKERIDKLLGMEWDTILMNEISQQMYDVFELLVTRLNPNKGVKPLFLLDQNPPKKSHWSYKKFHENIDPTTGLKLSKYILDNQAYIKMNPADNAENLNESYLDMLNTLSEAKKNRFLYGEYGSDTEGALWKSQWIMSHRIEDKPKGLIRVVVAIDPNVTEDKKVNTNTDAAGIITVGKFKLNNEDHYCVIRDDTTPGLSWGKVGCDVYHAESSDCIVGETNNGGDLVELNIRNYDKFAKFKPVRASRGKEIRAEPIADLYRRGFVHHLGELPDLEIELTTWVPGQGRSPNRLDALVWGITELMGSTVGASVQTSGW